MKNNYLSVIDLAKELIRYPSTTPDHSGCLEMISTYLTALGFQCESLTFENVPNLWARYGHKPPLFVFVGHTDVVPTGPLEDWTHPPFGGKEENDYIYGRGACDMKGAIAAMLVATQEFLQKTPHFSGSMGFLLTGDEEGPALYGTKKVIEVLTARGEKIDYCLIGEPSSDKQVGDQIRIGRRGSLHGKIEVHGKQGHVAHPHLAQNPIHQAVIALHELAQTIWDEGNSSFPPTTFQITNVHSGTGALNVIPGHLQALINFRYSTASTVAQLQEFTETLLRKHQLNFAIEWCESAKPFLTASGKLLSVTEGVIKAMTNKAPRLSTGGGTSDGRFIAPTGAEILELGLSHASAHQINEGIGTHDLILLTHIYEKILDVLLQNE